MKFGVPIRLAVVAGVLAATGSARAQDVARMEQAAEVAVSEGFMGAVLVGRGDEVLFSKGYGAANIEWAIPALPSTRFRIASITKQFTAAAILLLAERQKLALSDPIAKHIPDMPAAWGEITIFHLLTHTSGLTDSSSLPLPDRVGPATLEQVVARFSDRPLDSRPGEAFKYSNPGYVLLGLLIEKVSGEPYAQFLGANIFTPLGMHDSMYDTSSAIIDRRASGYVRVGGVAVNAPYIDMALPYAAGGLVSTTQDLFTWTRGLFGGKVLSMESLEKMTTPVMGGYGFGVYIQSVGGRRFVYHGGGINGFSSALLYFPDSGVTVAILANVAGTADALAGRLSAIAHD